jgi:hypothetical protein
MSGVDSLELSQRGVHQGLLEVAGVLLKVYFEWRYIFEEILKNKYSSNSFHLVCINRVSYCLEPTSYMLEKRRCMVKKRMCMVHCRKEEVHGRKEEVNNRKE